MQGPPNNDRFIDAVFGRSNPGVFTVSFRGPMAGANWNRNPFCSDPLANNYFCVSTLKDPNGRRTPDNCAALHVLLVDDVGTKVEPSRAAGILGDPTYSIETSAGNFQWGYLLDPPDADPLHAEALVRGMVKAFTADAAGRNRVARLPYGTNGKNGFETRFTRWMPDTKLTPELAFEYLEATPIEPQDLAHGDALPPDHDPIIQALDLAGHPYESTRTAGLYQVQCPWLDGHSDGRDDGAAYLSPTGFNCFHGHCADKTFADFRSFLGVSASEVDGAIADAAFGALSTTPAEIVNPISPDAVGTEAGVGTSASVPAHPWLSETPLEFTHESGRFLTRAELQDRYPVEWLFDGVIPMGIPWCIAGPGGLGKSRIMLAMCMSLASGVPLGNDFRPARREGAPVIFLTQEDDKPQRGHRFITQYEYLCQRDARWDTDEVRERLGKNLFMPSLEWGQQLTTEFRKNFKLFLSQMPVPPVLTVFDPLVLFWDHSNKEASINSAMGSVDTMRLLLKMSKNDRKDPFSVAVCHHVSKEGEVYGSAILTATLRVVFTVEQEGEQVQMRVVKVNSSNIQGRVYPIDRSDDGSASVYPNVPRKNQSDEQRLAGLIHSGSILWDVPPSKLVSQAMATGEFESKAALEGIVTPGGVWHTDTEGSDDKLAALGLERGQYNRYKPVAGWSGES